MSKLVSIIVPLFNEEEIIRTTCSRLKEVAGKWEDDYELIFIDDIYCVFFLPACPSVVGG